MGLSPCLGVQGRLLEALLSHQTKPTVKPEYRVNYQDLMRPHLNGTL